MRYNLSEINEVIRNRRSVKPESYSGRKVHKEIVQNILTNATWAPTHGMTQPWRFKVFMEEGLNKLSEFLPALYKELTPEDKFSQKKYETFQNRPKMVSVIIAICMERDKDGLIREVEEIEAVACAVQNMALTSTAYGLGSFWATPPMIYHEKMNAFLGIGPEDKCLGLFFMGYTEQEWPKAHRKPLEYVTEWITE
ncbi:MAG: hypothetical protein RL226_425 [Bacteroidota bacterium]|jgi:nitroreductase